ncbi:hypothetical protein C0J52_28473 [Blattella germanica]|nr:hypothetical protein C0J52_28473 [Blattella germanica]
METSPANEPPKTFFTTPTTLAANDPAPTLCTVRRPQYLHHQQHPFQHNLHHHHSWLSGGRFHPWLSTTLHPLQQYYSSTSPPSSAFSSVRGGFESDSAVSSADGRRK